MEKVLVTGGAGFIGSHVVEALLRKNYAVAVIDNFSTGHHENIAGLPVDLYICDIADPAVINVIQSIQPDYIIHLAAQISVSQSVADPLFDERTNVTGSLNIMNAARLAEVKKIVFASSAAVYGNPIEIPVTTKHPTKPESPYGLTKLTVEHYLQMFEKFYQLPYSILRFSNVYGPRQDAEGEGGVVSIFSDRIQKGTPPMIYGDGDQTRDFIFVKDVAAAAVAAINVKESLCVNISSQTAISIKDLFQLMKDVSGSELDVYYGPKREGDIRHSVLSNQLAKELLHWEPTVSLSDGLRMTIRSIRRKKRAAVQAR
ncbi:NAD-dependent epimerase/dehydratase family protein [Sporolactobacillus laevolacticus]|uniref:UDP-glucose 4-epimerase n=1 Tax=Sporolactobacillus laevolacticus DSM 442 TaxID=1395513 RepID=V6J3G4_9BACL|nr:NAD-dependent epimerase/dehydratase family protein [Sporolactobacillus laevolacticus]EST11244.1 UDP-glucose 4-epimerase [Sporolactobacillus laevolacticus DSM 442]MDN3954941.1 GDP-mannose 4,6-dehydratase [Sporolactobacillus laevolacticus]